MLPLMIPGMAAAGISRTLPLILLGLGLVAVGTGGIYIVRSLQSAAAEKAVAEIHAVYEERDQLAADTVASVQRAASAVVKAQNDELSEAEFNSRVADIEAAKVTQRQGRKKEFRFKDVVKKRKSLATVAEPCDPKCSFEGGLKPCEPGCLLPE